MRSETEAVDRAPDDAERYRRIVHQAFEGIWEIDAATVTTFVNPRMAEMLGYADHEMIGRALADFMDDEGRLLMQRNVERRRAGISERHEFKFLRKDGTELWAELATNPMHGADGTYCGALAFVSDITQKRQSEELTWRHANFDDLTGLPNRHMFTDRLEQETRKADRGESMLALLFIDLDHFKEVNDRLGHATGDRLLVEAARRIASCVRATDSLARLGGDEFTVILSGLDSTAGVERIAQTVVGRLAQPFVLGEETVFVSASVGIALYPPDAKHTPDLLAFADQAMYAAKNAGRNRYSYFTPELQCAARERQLMSADLRAAIVQGEFEVLYQPIVALASGEVRKAEALLRWRHPRRGLLEPAEFIPFAESTGLIVAIGDWVFRQAARQAQEWKRALDPRFQVCVNKSAVQFQRDAELVQDWADYVAELGLPPESLTIEIKEGVLFDGAANIADCLREYRRRGLQLALDDFGTGYSSLAHLASVQLDYVKIDRSTVSRIEEEGSELALCEAIIAMAHKLGLQVVAEGVETRLQQALLADAGCDYAQGYVFAPPLPAAELAALARRQS